MSALVGGKWSRDHASCLHAEDRLDDGVRSSGAKLWLQGYLGETFGTMEATHAVLEVRSRHDIGCLRSVDGGFRSAV